MQAAARCKNFVLGPRDLNVVVGAKSCGGDGSVAGYDTSFISVTFKISYWTTTEACFYLIDYASS